MRAVKMSIYVKLVVSCVYAAASVSAFEGSFQLSQVLHSNQGTLKHNPGAVTEAREAAAVKTYSLCTYKKDDSSCEERNASNLPIRTRPWEWNWSSAQPHTAASGKSMKVPDTTDHDTVVAFTTMAYNAYHLPKEKKWITIPGYHEHENFGFTDDGVRGHVFSNSDNSVHVISFKGTTAELLGVPDGPSGHKDKTNDNLMFSCCCGHVDWTWPSYCGCYQKKHECSQSCLVENVGAAEDTYYHDALRIFGKIRKEFPNATIWTTGHSLGGSIAALIALNAGAGIASVTVEAPGELLYARRAGIHIPANVSDAPIWHFGHNADPIFIGECRGFKSSCYYSGYAMESRCHAGYKCTFDVFADPPPEPPKNDTGKNHWWWPWEVATQLFRTFQVPDDDSDLRVKVLSVSDVGTEKDDGGDGGDDGGDDDDDDRSEYPDPRTRRWHVLVQNHRIKVVLHQVVEPWPGVAECIPADNSCVDCADWQFT